MTGKEVFITIKGNQANEVGEESCIELTTIGKYFVKNQVHYILYEDTELTGMHRTTTSVKAERDKVILNRMGETEHRQVFEKGILNESYYVTAFSKMLMGVIPSRVEVNLTDDGGSINLEYELEIGREKISDNKLLITVRGSNC